MGDTDLKKFYRRAISILAVTVLGQCNIEVGNPDSNLPESMRSAQNLSFNLAVGGVCTATDAKCTSVPVVLPDSHFPGMTYEMTAVNFQLAGLQLKPHAETSIWTQLDLLRGSSVMLAEYTDSGSVAAVALKFQPSQLSTARTFEITGNLVTRLAGARVVLPLTLEFSNQLLAEAAVTAQGAVLDGVEFDAATWFDFSDAKGDFGHIFKALATGACVTPDTSACAGHRETIARQVSRRISRSMSVKTHPGGKSSQQTKKTP